MTTSAEELSKIISNISDYAREQLRGHKDVWWLICAHVQDDKSERVTAAALGGNIPKDYVAQTLISHAGTFITLHEAGEVEECPEQPVGHA